MARNLLTFRLVENLFCYVCLTFFFMLKSIWCTLHMFYFLLFYFYIQILFVLFLATRLFSLWCNRIEVSIDQRRYGATQISYSQNHQEYIFWDSISVTAIRRNWELMNQCKSSARSKCKIETTGDEEAVQLCLHLRMTISNITQLMNPFKFNIV